MTGQSDYLPPGLPHNRGEWPQEYRDMEWLDLRACYLVRMLSECRIPRTNIVREIETVEEKYREHFRARLNYWREYRESRGKTT